MKELGKALIAIPLICIYFVLVKVFKINMNWSG